MTHDEFILNLLLLGWTDEENSKQFKTLSEVFIKNESTLYISTDAYKNQYERVVRYYPKNITDIAATSFITFEECITYLIEEKS